MQDFMIFLPLLLTLTVVGPIVYVVIREARRQEAARIRARSMRPPVLARRVPVSTAPSVRRDRGRFKQGQGFAIDGRRFRCCF